jgi:hypothetical protein
MTSKYQWPASRLGDKEMALLFQEKQKAKTSICELLRRAVNIAYDGIAGEKGGSEWLQNKSRKAKSRRL